MLQKFVLSLLFRTKQASYTRIAGNHRGLKWGVGGGGGGGGGVRAMSRPAEPRAPGVCFSSLADSPLFQQGLRTTPGTCKADYS